MNRLKAAGRRVGSSIACTGLLALGAIDAHATPGGAVLDLRLDQGAVFASAAQRAPVDVPASRADVAVVAAVDPLAVLPNVLAVPEPGAWLLMLAGVGLFTLRMRRFQRR